MDPQDFLAAFTVGEFDHHLPIKASRTQKRRVQHVRSVGRRQNDNVEARIEAVEFTE